MIAVDNLKAIDEVASFIAGTDPAKVLAFRPSSETRSRVSDLIEREKTDGISLNEKQELDYYMHLEHLMRMAKIFARKLTSIK